MFNSKMINVLSQFNNITDSIILKYPKTVAISDNRDVVMSCDFSKLDADEFPEICLYNNLSAFLGIMKLIGDGKKVTFSNNVITVSSADGKQKSNIIMQNKNLMELYDLTSEQIDRTIDVPTVAEFDILVDDFKKLRQALSILHDLDCVKLITSDSGVTLELGSSNKFQDENDSFIIDKECETTKDFELKLEANKLVSLPISDYTLQVKYNEARDAYRVLLINKTIPDFVILLAIKA